MLDAVTFSVREQELICVLGPYDSGKTTLLQAIAGLLPVAKGEIELVGEHMSTPMISVPAFDRAGESGFCLPGAHDAGT